MENGSKPVLRLILEGNCENSKERCKKLELTGVFRLAVDLCLLNGSLMKIPLPGTRILEPGEPRFYPYQYEPGQEGLHPFDCDTLWFRPEFIVELTKAPGFTIGRWEIDMRNDGSGMLLRYHGNARGVVVWAIDNPVMARLIDGNVTFKGVWPD